METMVPTDLLICRVGSMLLGIPLGIVERVELAVEVSPLPVSVPGVCGVVDVRGNVTPVLDPRPGLKLEARKETRLSDQLVLLQVDAGGARRAVALLVDEAIGIRGRLPGDDSQRSLAENLPLVEGMGAGDRVLILGEELIIVRADGTLAPPALLDSINSAMTTPDIANAVSETGMSA